MTSRLLRVARRLLWVEDDHGIERDALAARMRFESAQRSICNSVGRINDRGMELMALGDDVIRQNEGARNVPENT